MRQILGVCSAPRPRGVGNGFPVRTMLSHRDQGEHISPFIMLDYAGPAKFEPTTASSDAKLLILSGEQRRAAGECYQQAANETIMTGRQ
jgi:hypothetical protein